MTLARGWMPENRDNLGVGIRETHESDARRQRRPFRGRAGAVLSPGLLHVARGVPEMPVDDPGVCGSHAQPRVVAKRTDGTQIGSATVAASTVADVLSSAACRLVAPSRIATGMRTRSALKLAAPMVRTATARSYAALSPEPPGAAMVVLCGHGGAQGEGVPRGR